MKNAMATLGRENGFPWVCLVLFWTAVGLLVGVTASVVLTAGRSRYRPEATLDISRQAGGDDVGPGTLPDREGLLRVAIAPVISPEASLELYGDLVAYLARKLGRQPVFLRGESYSDVNDLIRMRQCDLAMVCTYSYILTMKEQGARLLAVPEIGGKRIYHSLILVPARSKAAQLSDLRDRRFASSDVLSCSGWLYPMARLKQEGFDPARFFREHVISGSHDRSVFAVRSGVVDGAAVDSIVFEQMVATDPELANELKVVERSPAFGMPPFVVPSGVPQALRDRLQRVLLEMHHDADGQGVLLTLGFDRFVIATDEEYASVRRLHELWQETP